MAPETFFLEVNTEGVVCTSGVRSSRDSYGTANYGVNQEEITDGTWIWD